MQRYNINVIKKVKPFNSILRLFVHEKRYYKPIDISEIRNILIVEISLIGDEIMTIPFYMNLKANCPNAYITVLGKKWISNQLIEQGLIDEIIEFDGLKLLASPFSWIKYRREIKNAIRVANKKNYDICFEPRGDIRYTLFMHFMNAKRKVSFDLLGNDYMMTDPIKSDGNIIHEIPHRLSLLDKMGFDLSLSPTYPVLEITEKQKVWNSNFIKDNLLTGRKIIGIHPGASLKDKQYPKYPEAVKKVIERLTEIEKYTFLIFCGPNEEQIAKSVEEAVRGEDVECIVVKEKLENYIGLINICDYMICNDSGAGHVAAAYGIPVTVIFGPVLAEMYSPMGRNNVFFISHNIECKPCQKRECPKRDVRCLLDILPNEVADVVMEMLSDYRKN